MQHLHAMLSADDLAHLEADVLRARLGELIRGYARQGTAELAESVVDHIEALYLHPCYCREPEEQCAFRRLARHWRLLAARRGVQRSAAAI